MLQMSTISLAPSPGTRVQLAFRVMQTHWEKAEESILVAWAAPAGVEPAIARRNSLLTTQWEN
jgi:hypothetical protein